VLPSGEQYLLSATPPKTYNFSRANIHSCMRIAMTDPEIIMSPLCREITRDDTKIQVDIYRGEDESLLAGPPPPIEIIE